MIRWTFYYKDQKDLAKQLALTVLGVILFVPTLVGIVSCGALLLNEDGGDPTAFFLPLLGYLGCYAAQAIILMLCERPYWFGFFAPLLLACIWGKYSLGKALLLGVCALVIGEVVVYFIDWCIVSRRKRKGLPCRHLPRLLYDPWGKRYRAIEGD
jgi:hypothetical protein